MQAAGNLPPLHTPEDGKDVDAKQQIAIEPNDTSALDQERSRVLSLVNDVIADYQVKTAVIERQPTCRVGLEELAPLLEIDGEPVDNTIARFDGQLR